MNEIEHEGKTYILKSQVESIIKDRVSKVAQRATEAENQVSSLTKEIDSFKSKQASIDMLSEQITSLKAELKTSETKFSRYQNMTKLGISEPELIEAIEWQYDKAMTGKSQKELVPLNEWLQSHIDDVDNAPLAIRPHLQNIIGDTAPQEANEAPQIDHEGLESLEAYNHAIHEVSEPLQRPQPPQTNRGAVPTPEGKDILRKAMSDPEFYSKNAEAVKAAWMSRYGR
jgi:hypothetical protein